MGTLSTTLGLAASAGFACMKGKSRLVAKVTGLTLGSAISSTTAEFSLFPYIHDDIILHENQIQNTQMLIESMSLEELKELSYLLSDREQELTTKYVKK